MAKEEHKVQVSIDEALFLEFALYDIFVRQKKIRAPLIFALIMSVFGVVCFLLKARESQAWILGTVLFVLGWGLPAAYVLQFFLSVRTQSKHMGLKRKKTAYVVTLTEAGVSVSSGKEMAEYSWDSLYAVVYRKKCTYLYASPQKAYLLPHSQVVKGPEALHLFISKNLKRDKKEGLQE